MPALAAHYRRISGMRKYTERQSFTVPADVKAKLKQDAKARGISMSEHVRQMVADMIAWHDLEIFIAELAWKKATMH